MSSQRQFFRTAVPNEEGATSESDTDVATHSGRWKLLPAGLVLSALVACAVLWWQRDEVHKSPSSLASSGFDGGDSRFLTSAELAETVVKHAISFHEELNGEHFKLTPKERDELERELLPQATAHALTLGQKVMTADEDAGRKLQELRLTDEHWAQTHELLQALHDSRVQKLGQDMAKTLGESGGDEKSVSQMLAQRHDLRELGAEFVPSSVHSTPAKLGQHWQLAVDSQGGLDGKGSLGSWDAEFQIDRRLQATGTGLAASPTVQRPGGKLAYILWLTLGTTMAAILGIVATVLTATLGAPAAMIIYTVLGSVGAATCGTSLGLAFVPAFRGVAQWIPCMILSGFTGLDAIWTDFGRAGSTPGTPGTPATPPAP